MGLLVYGQKMASLYPGYGKKQFNRILYNLAQVSLSSMLPLGHLKYFPVRLFPRRSIIVMLSTVDSQDLETYARLRSYGYDVLLISPDPVEYAARIFPQTEIKALAIRVARVERTNQLEQLLKLGIQVINWQVDQPFEKIIQRTTRYFSHRRSTWR